MPDITMCNGNNCPLKEQCFRFTATPSEYHQSYFSQPPYNKETNDCEYFWETNTPNTPNTLKTTNQWIIKRK